MANGNGNLVPGEVAVAVWTGRREFLALLRGRLARGEKLPDDQIAGLVDLCEEFIVAHYRDLERLNRLRITLGDLTGLMKAYETLSYKARETMTSIEKDQHDSEGKVTYAAAEAQG
jgi:hypothetical protein